MELRYRREAAVGLLLIVATAIFVFLLVWLRGKSLKSGQLIEIAFDDVSGLKVGDPVRTSGVPVGQVNDIRLVAPGRVEVTLKLHSAPAPRRDARATVRLLDFFGARYVDYLPGAAAASLPAGSEIRGEKEEDLTGLARGLSGQGQEVLANAAAFLGPENARQLRGLLTEARGAVNKLGTATETGGQQAAAALQSLREVLQHLDLLLGGDAASQTFNNMRDASRNLAQVTATLQRTTSALDSILDKINAGQGSLGRVVNDTTLVTDLHAASTALTALLTDLKAHPGRYVQVRIF
jgi:phospholipid/cholesterol/gamma-HCH transport system substrate-binding protein